MKRHHILKVRVQIELRKEADDSYIITCPQLGCIFVHEVSEEAAYRAAREAVEAYMRTSTAHDDPIPDEVVISHEIQEDRPLLPPPELASISTLEITRDLAVAV